MTTPLLSYASLYDLLQIIFWLVLTLYGFTVLYSWRKPRKRDVPRMYIQDAPYNDDRDSIKNFRKVFDIKDEQR
jgi:hypothetical protein